MQTNTYSAAAPVGPVAHGSIIDGLAPSQAQNQNSFAPYRMCGGAFVYTVHPSRGQNTKMAGIPRCKQTFHQAGRHQSIFCKQNELYSRKESYAYQLRMQGHNKGELR